jgi:O-antigen/teichoic acid export membrane protein
LAISSLFLTLGWLVYYELDLIIIGKWFGAKDVAIYAIGFTFLNFLRTLWNTVFSPFSQRFNHFVGMGYLVELKMIINTIIDYTLPLCIVTTVTLFVSAEKLVLFWVGPEYHNSVIILQILILGTAFVFITQPASYYFTAKTKYKYINLKAFSLPLVFIFGLTIFVSKFGIVGIAMSKTIAMFIGFIISTIGISSIINPMRIIRKWFFPTLALSSCIFFLLREILPALFSIHYKSSGQLVILILLLVSVILIGYFILLMAHEKQRKELILLFNNLW